MIIFILSAITGCAKKTSPINTQTNKIPQVNQNNNPEQSKSDQEVSEKSKLSKEEARKLEFEEIVPEVPSTSGYRFSNGMGIFRYNEKYGYIGEDGKVKIEPKYKDGGIYSEDHAIVSKADGAIFIIDKQGNEIPLSADYEFVNGFARELNKFVDGVAFFKILNRKTADGKGGLAAVDTSGKEVFRLNGYVYYAGMVKGNYMLLEQGNGLTKILIYDKSWKKISEFPFSNVDSRGLVNTKLVNFDEGLISTVKMVNGSNLYGIIDTKGNTVIDFTFEELKVPSGGMIAFKKYGKWGFIDYTGKVVIEPTYDEAYAFSNGLCPVKIENKIGFIDNQNIIVIKPTFDPTIINGDNCFKFNNDGIALVSSFPAIFIDKTGQPYNLNGSVVTSFNFKESIVDVSKSEKIISIYKLKK